MLPVSKKFLVLFLIILLSGIKTLGQTKKIDSLRQVLRTAGMDTNRVKALGFLSSLIGANNPDTAIILASQSLLLSKKLKWKKGEAVAELKLGNLNHSISNQKKALFHFNNGLNVCEALLASQNPIDIKYGKKIKGTIIGNIAGVYQAQGNLPKALEYYLNGLKIAEEVGDKHAIGRGFNNLATVFVTQANYPKALKYYFKSLKTAEEFGDKKGIGLILGNIANVYTAQENYPEALEYYFNGLRNSEESGHKIEVGRTLGNIANVFKVQVFSAVSKNDMVFAKTKLYPKALEYYLKSLKIAEEMGDKRGTGATLCNMGSLHTALGKYKEAEGYLKRGLLISEEIAGEDDKMHQQEFLYTLYEKSNRPALALEHYKKFIALRETIFSNENSKKLMRTEMDYDYEKKEAVAKVEHVKDLEKQQAVADEKNRKQNIVIGSVVIGLLLVIVFAGFVFRSLKITRKQKIVIEVKNKETEEQKKVIEEKQKEILDSIHYAKRIQTALITSEKYVDKNLQRLNRN